VETLPLDLDSGKTVADLIGFLDTVREDVLENGAPRLLSVTMEAPLLDPLAVLETIYESNELSIYIERQNDGLAVAGAEAAISFTFSGAGRFEEAKEKIVECLDNSIAFGDEDLPFFGPRFFCGFSFFDEVNADDVFPSALVFVPSWQVAVIDSRCVATANALIEADTDVDAVGNRLWKAKERFQSFSHDDSEVKVAQDESPLEILNTQEQEGSRTFEDSVSEAISKIEAGDFEKVVLARAQDFKANGAFHPLRMLNGLRESFPDCFAFSFSNGKGQSFIGASPERLASLSKGVLETEALAGSAPRGSTATEDARYGSQLLNSSKDRREQGYVLDSIRRRLGVMSVDVEENDTVRLKKLRNVQHLQTLVRGNVKEGAHVLDFIGALHPTPAVGGVPREQAIEAIPDLEGFSRSLYAGAIGYVDHQGEGDFLVGIRSAQVDGETARLYAGVGIVDGSNPGKELQETDVKFRALMDSLL